jgi:hypothetical protein
LQRTEDAGEEVNLVYGWLLGKMTPKGQVSSMLFGQFTQNTVPPKRNWTYIGANVKMDDSLQHAREEEGQGEWVVGRVCAVLCYD